VRDWEGELSLLNTSNAATPLTGTYVPLLAIDIWEHAYYIDYRNDRSKYLEAIRALLNWKFASQCFDVDGAFNATREMSGRRAA
jgi:Fe-Mn family superoxide dismutase